ncbi:hypothetical protein V5S81_08990, partial [Corynebacterium sanguinis]|uniref:hypothetical protein n=1 Tax=Corynebacterium sanguinis TaxID=2594913 RepID=UPI003080F58D
GSNSPQKRRNSELVKSPNPTKTNHTTHTNPTQTRAGPAHMALAQPSIQKHHNPHHKEEAAVLRFIQQTNRTP